MQRPFPTAVVTALLISSLQACQREQRNPFAGPAKDPARTSAASPAASAPPDKTYAATSTGVGKPPAQPTTESADTATGTVQKTMNSGGYTYAQINTGKAKLWAAARETKVQIGERITFSTRSPLKNFRSKTLNQTFEEIYFVDKFARPGSAAPAAGTRNDPHAGLQGNPHGLNLTADKGAGGKGYQHQPTQTAAIEVKELEKATGGVTVAELHQKRDELKGRTVALRGKVAKFNKGILGKSWIHVQDGTGKDKERDLTVTTPAEVALKVGDTVLVRGRVMTNRDFGYGYKYDVMLEDALVRVESR
jgi:hypothetical protein